MYFHTSVLIDSAEALPSYHRRWDLPAASRYPPRLPTQKHTAVSRSAALCHDGPPGPPKSSNSPTPSDAPNSNRVCRVTRRWPSADASDATRYTSGRSPRPNSFKAPPNPPKTLTRHPPDN
ncbi:hypothetical protein EDD29_7957 [Actinocorallia herbida]|uniref:Uncharacterized protein n=1 Tax=Actinocorallia herbida TaxID=58109 RepID=A0A3N1D9R4_9ACTN|nr:hypothetical protein EDD29_7957 [Actinocorallia herbida]